MNQQIFDALQIIWVRKIYISSRTYNLFPLPHSKQGFIEILQV